ncbi:MAG: TRAP transporter small permease [Salinispira sp.]
MGKTKERIGQLLLGNFEVILSSVFLSVTILVVILNVILRYVFNGGLFWVEEVATTCFIWSVFIGAASAYRKKLHIGIDIIVNKLPENMQAGIAVIINALMVIINGYVCYLSIVFTSLNSQKRTPVLDIPSAFVNVSITLGFGIITLYAVYFLITSIAALSPMKSTGESEEKA